MHEKINAITKDLDKTLSPHEDILMEPVPEYAKSVVTQARAIGVPWATIWALVMEYGGQFVQILEAIIAALNKPVPTPIPPAPGPVVPTA